ncbi:MAG: single-stranded-DNA-specific exonuclease RecJ [Lachnospiraceae bacterium]|nr:single-stranded-DNA-specific exonuclease RecJ [Lachnospiraceae bacterium]
MSNWVVSAKKADFQHIAEKFGIDPVIARIIRNRDVCTEEEIETYLHGGIEALHDPHEMKGMDEASKIILEEIQKGTKIRIIGDYDVDGICSTYILVKGLQSLGAIVDAEIPHRMKDGYGLNERLIREASEAGIGLIVTCDNGIAAKNQIALAKELGMRVVVTDHHEVPFEEKDGEKLYLMPEAEAVVDPKQPGETYPFSGICGAVVAWKLLQVLEVKQDIIDLLMEPAAVATVCDVMDLLDENRALVKLGIERLKESGHAGIRALMEVTGLDKEKLSVYHLGFVLGPCMNATGRLDSAKTALSLWQTEDRGEAVRLANELKEMNESRKEMTEYGKNTAIAMIEEQAAKTGKLDDVLVVYLPDCHESIAGIIAGRLKEKYHHPAIVLTKAEEGVKGSGRSIEAYHMFEKLTEAKEFLTKFGGHKLAAGLSLKEENVAALRDFLNAHAGLCQEDFEPKVVIDVPMPLSYISENLIQQLTLLEPFGNGNPKPVFAQKDVEVLSLKIIGKNRNVVKGTVRTDAGRTMELMYFGDIPQFQAYLEEKGLDAASVLEGARPNGTCRITMTYYLQISEFRGNRTMQVIMTDFINKNE